MYLTNRIDRAGRNYDFTYAYPTDLLKSQTQYLEEGGNSIAVTTKFDYDEHFNSLRITEPRNRYVETYLFDIQSRIIGVTNIEGQVMSVDYGLLNMKNEIARFDGSKVTYGFDQYARHDKMTIISDGTNYVVEAEYNTDNTLKNIKDSESRVDLSYNIRNEVTAAVSSNVVETAYNYKYDGIGSITNTSLLCSRVAPAREMNISYIYNPTNGLASSWTNSASGIFCSYEYDIMDRPISLAWKASDGSIIKSYNYLYSNADMITNVVDSVGNITKYEFDTLDRLTSEDDGDNITSYSYDLAGNRTQKILTTNQTNLTNNYALGVGNRLASWGTNGVARYNTAGCLTNMVSNTDGRELNLSWDERYQLTSVDSVSSNEVGGKVSYDYDVLGQRVSRKEIRGSTTNTEYYIHNGVNIVADLDEDKELLRSYSYAPGYDNIISMTSYGNETNTYFYIRNHVNSVVALIDEDGGVAESYTYTAYGEVTVFDANGNELNESALGNRYTFQGREIDWSTGLYNFRTRWYSSETGRWLSKDPIGINGGLNQYVFCGNNPVMFVDPEGNKWWYVDYWADRSLDGSWVNKSFSCVMGTFAAAIPDLLVIDARLAGAFTFGAEAGVGYIINLHDFSVSKYGTAGIGFGRQMPSGSLTGGLAWNFDKVSPTNQNFDGPFDELSVSVGGRTGSIYRDNNGWAGFSYGYTNPGVGVMYSKVEYEVDGAVDKYDGHE